EIVDHPWLQNSSSAPNVSLGDAVKARLEQFSAMNKLKKTALRVRVSICVEAYALFSAVGLACCHPGPTNLSVEEAASIKEIFQLIDARNKGKIDIDDIRIGLLKLGHQVNGSCTKLFICNRSRIRLGIDCSYLGVVLRAGISWLLTLDVVVVCLQAANYLNIKGLLDLTFQYVTDQMKGKTAVSRAIQHPERFHRRGSEGEYLGILKLRLYTIYESG
ncbi:Calcium-dependent protein kinase 32, partial [Linum grandiflorum]